MRGADRRGRGRRRPHDPCRSMAAGHVGRSCAASRSTTAPPSLSDCCPVRARPFLLVHGLASNALLWRGVAEALHRQWPRVVVVDLRGTGGRTDRSCGHRRRRPRRTSARCGRTRLAGQSTVLVGQSWGGNVVLRAATTTTLGRRRRRRRWLDPPRPRFPTLRRVLASLAPPNLVLPEVVVPRIGAMVADWPAHSAGARSRQPRGRRRTGPEPARASHHRQSCDRCGTTTRP